MSSYENLSPQVITRIAREIQELSRKPAPGAFWGLGNGGCRSIDLLHGTNELRCGAIELITPRSIDPLPAHIGIRLLQEHSESIAEIHAEIDGPGALVCFSCWVRC